jgi:hypothetical protein
MWAYSLSYLNYQMPSNSNSLAQAKGIIQMIKSMN